jgi:hypothetical protein
MRPSEPVEYLFRFHLPTSGNYPESWHELTFKWKLSLGAANAKIQQIIKSRYGQYDIIETYVIRGFLHGGAWTNVGSLWWFPAKKEA